MNPIKPIRLAILVLFVLASCAQEDAVTIQDSAAVPADEFSELRDQIDRQILATVRASGKPFNWNEADPDFFYEALRTTDGLIAVGYKSSASGRSAQAVKSELIDVIYGNSQRTFINEKGESEELVKYEEDRIGVIHVRIPDRATLDRIRAYEGTAFVEVKNYAFDHNRIIDQGKLSALREEASANARRDMILDPAQSDPDYVDQVAAFDGGLRTVMRRHNMETAYRNFGVYGSGIGVTILDNGLLPESYDFFYNSGYGQRRLNGLYTPLYFIPLITTDGTQPRPYDIFGISLLFYDTYYVHGSQMIKQALTLAPNADIQSFRASNWTVILFPDQVNGIVRSLMAAADDDFTDVASMSMGTIIEFNEIVLAIEYYMNTGKVFICSAGSTAPIISDLLGVLFPGKIENIITATAIENREETGGAFVIAEGSHGGPEVDFTVENTGSSSVSASRTAGMVGLVWSANPSLDRNGLEEVLIASSYYYQNNNGQKHPKFGWGTIDVGLAVELAIAARTGR